jgi:hypothetical protein
MTRKAARWGDLARLWAALSVSLMGTEITATDTVANIHQWSLRQVVTPDHLAGRVTAGHRFAVYGAGALAGGALGTAMGLRPALLVCAVGALLSPLLALCSPLRQLRQQPTSDRLTF